MSSRTLLQYLTITAKGLAMGAADVVPGVSGGTIAFISGIYEELIETVHKLDIGFFSTWKKQGFLTAWNMYNIGFLTALFFWHRNKYSFLGKSHYMAPFQSSNYSMVILLWIGFSKHSLCWPSNI
jgi:uncharacterized membrane protein